MAIAPITGKLRKHFWVDLTTALGLGVGAGYAYWFVFFRHPYFTELKHIDRTRFRYGVHLKSCKPGNPP